MMITEDLKLAVAQALQNEWGIDPWGRLSYQAENALKTDAKKALMFLAEAALEATILPFLEEYEKQKEIAERTEQLARGAEALRRNGE